MGMLKELNKRFEEGVVRGPTVFQYFLMAAMIVAAVQNNPTLLYVSTFSCVMGYFEPINEEDSHKN